MSIQFDEVDDHYRVEDDSSLALPGSGGAWCLGIWTRLDDILGSTFQYLISQGPLAPNGLHLYNQESGADAGRWYMDFWDGEGRRLRLWSAAYGGDGIDRLIVMQDVAGLSNAKQLWTCPAGGAAVLEQSTTAPFGAVNPGGPLNIGRRADGQTERYYGGVAGEFFKGDFSLSGAEIETLAGGQSILGLGKSPSIYLPMVSAAATISDSSGNGNEAERYGDPVTVTPHFISTAPGGGAPAAKAAHLRRMRQG